MPPVAFDTAETIHQKKSRCRCPALCMSPSAIVIRGSRWHVVDLGVGGKRTQTTPKALTSSLHQVLCRAVYCFKAEQVTIGPVNPLKPGQSISCSCCFATALSSL